MSTASFNFRTIGTFRSDFKEKFGTPRQPGLVSVARGSIEFEPWVQPELALQGLAEFSHAWVHFVFHLNSNENYNAKVRPPRARGESLGVFATRTPHRPNPLGLSLMKIDRVAERALYVSGPDVVDGTPILDVKPYLPEVESVPSASSGWLGEADPLVMQVSWACDVEPELKTLIEQTLSFDVRPEAYKKPQAKQSFALKIAECEVRFRFHEGMFEVISVL